MGSVPAFLLKKLYVKGSLRNTTTGFELAIQNTLAPGTIAGLVPLKVDGVEYPLGQTVVGLNDGTIVSAAQVSAAAPLRFSVGDQVTLRVQCAPLAAGTHTLAICPKTKEAGVLEISVQDTVA